MNRTQVGTVQQHPNLSTPNLIVYIYKNQRKLGLRHTGYKATVAACRRIFPDISTHEVIVLYTEELDICRGKPTEICKEIWNEVASRLREIIIMPKMILDRRDFYEGMFIVIEGATGNTLTLSGVESSHTVENIKAMIQDQEDIPQSQIRLYLESGRDMDDGRTLSDYNIRSGSTIRMRFAVRGGKPVIYLLAPDIFEAFVELSLVPQWSLSAIYPIVPIKRPSPQSLQKVTWKVQVHPNGELVELNTGLETAYLFWEALTNTLLPSSPPSSPRLGPISEPAAQAFDPTNFDINDNNAVVICVEQITPYLDATLKALGLHTEARSSFITYWLPSLLKHVYVALRFLPQAYYEQAAMLDISPVPDVVSRVFMVFQGVKEFDMGSWSAARARSEQDISFWINEVGIDVERTLNKHLFRVIEWGGMEVFNH